MLDFENVNFENLFYTEEDEKPYDDELDVDVEYKQAELEGVPKSALKSTAPNSALKERCVDFNLGASSVLELRALDRWNDGLGGAASAMEEDDDGDTEGEPDGIAAPLITAQTGQLVEKNQALINEVEMLRASVASYQSAHHEHVRQKHALQEKILNMEDMLKHKEAACSPPLSPLALMGRTAPLIVVSEPSPIKKAFPPPPPPVPSPGAVQTESRMRLEQANLNLDRAGLVLDRVRLGQDRATQDTQLQQEKALVQAQQTALEIEKQKVSEAKNEITRLSTSLQNEKVAVEQEKVALREKAGALEREKTMLLREKAALEEERERLKKEKNMSSPFSSSSSLNLEQHHILRPKSINTTSTPISSSTIVTTTAKDTPADRDLEVQSSLLPQGVMSPVTPSQIKKKPLRQRRHFRCYALLLCILVSVAIIVGGIKWAESAGMRVGPSL